MAEGITANFRAAPEGADADTHIVVNNQPRVSAPKNYSIAAPDISTRRYGDATLNGTVDTAPPRAQVVTHHGGINWGQVVKGAAIVTAVVVAAIIIYPLAISAASTALTWASTNSILGPILHNAVLGAHWLHGFAGAIWSAVAPAAAAAGGQAIVASPGVAAAIPGMAHGAGVLATAGTAIAGAAAAIPAIGHLHVFDPSTHHAVTTATLPDSHNTMADEASLSSLLTTKTHAIHAASQHDAMHQAADLAHHSAHHVSGGHQNGAHTPQDSQPNNEAPEMAEDERRARGNVSRALKANQNWAERVGGQRDTKASITPRDASYALQADTDRLNAALAEKA